MDRRWEFDALRGLMLVLMTVTHLPTVLSEPLGQPLGYVSAAEGFVLLSGFMAGWVYTLKARRSGDTLMRRALLKRAATVYACQAGLLSFLLTGALLIGLASGQRAISDLASYALREPMAAWLGGLTLLYAPPLLDILPLYILFLLASPWVLQRGRQQGWGWILAGSVTLWLAAQLGLGAWLYERLAATVRLPVPRDQTGAFNLMAWQFLWVLGLWLGATRADGRPAAPPAFPRWMVQAAFAIALTGLFWRHAAGQTPLPGNAWVGMLFDKWNLGPMRVLSLFALMVLLLHYADRLLPRLPRWRVLEQLGAASLAVFCAHLVVVLLVLALVGDYQPGRPLWIDAALLSVTFGLLWAVARARNGAGRHRSRNAIAGRAGLNAGVLPSRLATAGSPAD